MLSLRPPLLLVPCVLACGPLGAQEAAPGPPPERAPARHWTLPVETYLGPGLRVALGRRLARPLLVAPDGGPMRRLPALVKPVTFKPGKARLLPDAVAASLSGLDAKGRKAAAANFRAMLDAYERDAPKHDVAHALAYCLGTCQEAARGTEMKAEEVQELARRTSAVLLQTPEFQALRDRDRQAMYESLVLTGGMVGSLLRDARERGEGPAQAQARAMAQQVLDLFPSGPSEGGPEAPRP